MLLLAQLQQCVDVGVKHVCRRIGLERGVLTVPVSAQGTRDPFEGAGHRLILQVRLEQPEAPFEHSAWAGVTGAAEEGRGDAALRRPSGMQELRLRAVDPALQNARRAAAYNPGCVHEMLLGEAQHATGQVRDAEWREQACRMKAAAMELPRRDAADPARNFVADRDGSDQLLAGDGSVFRERQRSSD
jgi:hypothetical protein